MPDRKPIVFVATADTDILAAEQALSGLPEDFSLVHAFNPDSVDHLQQHDHLLEAAEQCGVVVLRLLGGKRAMSQAFDPLVRLCHARGIPLIACSGHQEWDEDLVAACSVPVAEVETVFSYLMHGGMIATVRALTGKDPRQFFRDSADPAHPRVRDLQEESRRVFRSRVVNPKWIDSTKRHGYKGAFELAATVDYMFGYEATAQVVEDWMCQDVTESYILDPEIQQFFQDSNPWALRGILERLLEAIERGLWAEPPPEMREQLQEMYLQLETDLEARQERRASD